MNRRWTVRSAGSALVMLLAQYALPPGAGATGPFTCEFEAVAEGVWVGIRPDSLRQPVLGTTTFVVGDEGVVVFDGGGLTIMAEHVIKKIRTVTAKPVTHVIISHWHGDHNLGIHRYLTEFPNVQVIGHEFTRAAMLGRPMRYVDDYPNRMPQFKKEIAPILESGKDGQGNALPKEQLAWFQRFLDDFESVHTEYNRVVITPPTTTIDDELTIFSGKRRIEIRHLGVGNTAGDLVMWLPEERIVATGDIVVHPTPYGFNVPPRAWAATLERIQSLDYQLLVPGHGDIQRDRSFVDLLIETAIGIADQRDSMLAAGLTQEEAEAKLDFSNVEDRFTGGDPFLKNRFERWFAAPFRSAAFKALTGEPMVVVEDENETEAE